MVSIYQFLDALRYSFGEREKQTIQGMLISKNTNNISDPPSLPVPYVISLDDGQCKNCDLAGGKGSSLAVLTELSNLTSSSSSERTNFIVPSGLVVTTEAFRRFLQSPNMSAVKTDLQKV